MMFSARLVRQKLGSLKKKLSPSPPIISSEGIPKAKGKNNLPLSVPKGCLAMYAGEECKRYVVPLKYLTSPSFHALLFYESQEELEPKIDGPIKLPHTTTQTFEELLKQAAEELTDGFLFRYDELIRKAREKNNLPPPPPPVPKGCLSMYVGEECKRYVVPLKYLTSPAFEALLKQSEEAPLELETDGPITLPSTTTQTFEEVLKRAAEQLNKWKLLTGICLWAA